jgi:hypothetical protein
VTAQGLFDRIGAVIEDSRRFVQSETYVGPDRRRRAKAAGHDGPERRRDEP